MQENPKQNKTKLEQVLKRLQLHVHVNTEICLLRQQMSKVYYSDKEIANSLKTCPHLQRVWTVHSQKVSD